ncbi:tail fiber protein [Serratia liquefaciens]
MAKNEFLPFGTAANANVLSNADYLALPARPAGFTGGVAKSEELNKVWRQTSVMANVLAQFIADQSGQDVLDNGDLATLKTNLQDAIKKYVNSGLPSASGTVAGITKLSSATDSADNTLAATPSAVKSAMDTAKGKADKNTALKNTSGWWKCGSSGVIYQWGLVTNNSQYTVALPIPFPTRIASVTATAAGPISAPSGDRSFVEVAVTDLSNITITCSRPAAGGGSEPYTRNVYWMAIGY